MKPTANITRPPCPDLPMDFGSGYETNYSAVLAEHCREVYASNYTLLQQLSRAQIEGVLEVTFRSRTGAVTVPVAPQAGRQLMQQVREDLGEILDKLEQNIAEYDARGAKEEKDAAEGTSDRARAFAFCLPMRPLSDEEFAWLPPEAQRAYDMYGATQRIPNQTLHAAAYAARLNGGEGQAA